MPMDGEIAVCFRMTISELEANKLMEWENSIFLYTGKYNMSIFITTREEFLRIVIPGVDSNKFFKKS